MLAKSLKIKGEVPSEELSLRVLVTQEGEVIMVISRFEIESKLMSEL